MYLFQLRDVFQVPEDNYFEMKLGRIGPLTFRVCWAIES